MRRFILFSRGRRCIATLFEDSRLLDVFVEPKVHDGQGVVGEFYKARVVDDSPSLDAVFLDSGLDRPVYLRMETGAQRPKVGETVLIQVKKPAKGVKGAQAAEQMTLADENIVYLPGAGFLTASQQLEDNMALCELREWLAELALPGEGWILRSAAHSATRTELQMEMTALRERWRRIEQLAASSETPVGVIAELRVSFHETLQLLAVKLRVSEWLMADELDQNVAARWFERFRKQMEQAQHDKFWLPSGGYLNIHETESLTVIDVNSGKMILGKSREDTALKVNLEAAAEIGRLSRLRGLGGILIVDFLRMAEEEARQRVISALETSCALDSARIRIEGFTRLGLLEMTRQHTQTFSLQELLEDDIL